MIQNGRRMPTPRTTVFVSYCRRNKRWLERLRVHLTPYERRGVLDLWDDSRIETGEQWRAEIDRAIERAAASILLVSADFLASDFVNVHELPKLLRKAERAGARVLPIIVEPCELSVHPALAAFQALNSPQQPLAAMSRAETERVWARAATTIGKLLETPARPEARAGREKAPAGDSLLFAELRSATVTLSVLWGLTAEEDEPTLSELERRLGVRSRKSAFEALERLTSDGWVEKIRRAGLVRYRVTDEGVRQLQRLVAASDGPVRRIVTPS